MTVNESYTRELKDNLNYTATWFPNVKLALGDVGQLTDYKFIPRTSLKNLGIPYKEGVAGSPATYSYMSAGSVTRDVKLAGKAPVAGSALADVDAGISFHFATTNAVVFLATNCTVRTIADQEPVKQAILEKYKAHAWDRDYVVVTELVSAGNTTVIIAEGSDGRYELKAKAGLAPTLESINVEGNFAVVHDSQIGFNFLAKSGLTPLFRCLGVRGIFRPKVVTREDFVTREQVGRAVPPETGGEVFTVREVEYEDYCDVPAP
jgi:hypothetical protein